MAATRFGAFSVLLLSALLAAPAGAADGVWRVGEGYVIHAEQFDLASPQGRGQLRDALDQNAGRLCRAVQPRVARLDCAAAAVTAALAAAPRVATAYAQAKAEAALEPKRWTNAQAPAQERRP